ncbi:MAG: cell division protein FtsB [Gammaproteobacteria bacterium]|nr:cell division protein FtsB [Gammaproteobacteria bacterium]
MKLFVVFLVTVFMILQYQLWIDRDGVRKLAHLSDRIDNQTAKNQQLFERNEVLAAEVEDLKSGFDAIEERARMELGMIREGETFFQVIEKENSQKTK